MNLILAEGERLVREGKANKTNFINSQGGTLNLTDRRLVFTGHGANLGKDMLSIDHSDILGYGPAFTFIIFFPLPIPNAIKVSLKNGKTYKFAVTGRKEWLSALGQNLRKSAV